MLHSVEIGSATLCYNVCFPKEEKTHSLFIPVFLAICSFLFYSLFIFLLLATIVTDYITHVLKKYAVQNF